MTYKGLIDMFSWDYLQKEYLKTTKTKINDMRLNLEELWYFYGLQQEEAPGKKIKEFVAGANQKLTETHVSRRETRKQHWGATGKASRMRTKNTTYGIQWCRSLWWPLFVGYFCFFFWIHDGYIPKCMKLIK